MKAYDKYSPYQMVYWEDYKKDFKSPEENNSFWVVVQKSEMDDFLNTKDIDLDTQLFGFEWPTKDEFRFLLLSKNAKAFHGFQQITKILVNLGHKDLLMFQNFQIQFTVERCELLAVLRKKNSDIDNNLKSILNIAIVPKESDTKTLGDILSKFPRLIKLEYPQSRYISKNLTLESFVFDPERITKYFTACIPDRLDFVLTYRNSDIIKALKARSDSLKKYLENCPHVSLLDARIEQTVSLLFPTYLRSYMMYLYQLQSDRNDPFYSKRSHEWTRAEFVEEEIKIFQNDYRRSLRNRNSFDLENLWNVLCILADDLAAVTCRFSKMFDKKPDIVSQLPEKVNALFKVLESYHSDSGEIVFPPERAAQSYDRSVAPESELVDYFYDGDIVRYFSNAQRCVDIDLVALRAFVDWLRREFKRCFKGIPRCDFVSPCVVNEDLFHKIFYGLIGDITPQNLHSCDMTGTLWPYFCWSTWDNSGQKSSVGLITDRTKLPLGYRAKIYAVYLEVNEYLSFIVSRISCLPTIYKPLKELSDCFCSVEQAYLKEFIEELLTELPENNNNLSYDEINKILTRFDEFRKSVINIKQREFYPLPFRRLPKSHLDLLANFDERIESLRQVLAERVRNAAEKKLATVEAQRDAFRIMGHSIKNVVGQVDPPLTQLKDKLAGCQRDDVEDALAGMKLIQNLAQGMDLSLRPGSWRKDIENPGQHPISLNSILFNAFRAALLNMFDVKFFQEFVANYFQTDQLFLEASQQCKEKKDQTEENFFECVNKYFFEFKCACKGNSNILIGDTERTATKLFILFQELFLNAVKYASYIDRKDRFIHIFVEINDDNWSFTIKNSAVQTDEVNPSGIGLNIIKNFAELFNAEFSSELTSGIYQSKLFFSLKEDKNAEQNHVRR